MILKIKSFLSLVLIFVFVRSTTIEKFFQCEDKTAVIITEEHITTGTVVKHYVSINSTNEQMIYYVLDEDTFEEYKATSMKTQPETYHKKFDDDYFKNTVLPEDGTYLYHYYLVGYNNGNNSTNIYVSFQKDITLKYWAYSMIYTGLIFVGICFLFTFLVLLIALISIFAKKISRKIQVKRFYGTEVDEEGYITSYEKRQKKKEIASWLKKDPKVSNEPFFTIQDYFMSIVKGLVAGLFCPYFIIKGLGSNGDENFCLVNVSELKENEKETMNGVQEKLEEFAPVGLREKKGKIEKIEDEPWFKLQKKKMELLKQQGETDLLSDLKSSFPYFYTPIVQSILFVISFYIALGVTLPIFITIFVIGIVLCIVIYYPLLEGGYDGTGDSALDWLIFIPLLIALLGLLGLIIDIAVVFVFPVFLVIDLFKDPINRVFFPVRISTDNLRRKFLEEMENEKKGEKLDQDGLMKCAIKTNNIETVKLLLFMGYKPDKYMASEAEFSYTSNAIFILVALSYDYYETQKELNSKSIKNTADQIILNVQGEQKMEENVKDYNSIEQPLTEETSKEDSTGNANVPGFVQENTEDFDNNVAY